MTPTVPQIDTTKTVSHKLGFVPIVWLKNLPGGNGIDGEPTFPREAARTLPARRFASTRARKRTIGR